MFPIDQRVLLFSLLLSCATGILFGIAPALETSRPGLVPALKGSDAAAGERRARFDLKKILVVGEVALSLLLLIAAGLFVRGLQAARAINPGVDVDKLVSAPLSINLLRYTRAQGREFYRQAVERVERLPGVESATVARVAVARRQRPRAQPPRRRARARPTSVRRARAGGVVSRDPNLINANVVGPGFFKTHRHPAGEGPRLPATRTCETGPPVVIVNATAAAMQFADANPIGSRVSVDGPDGPWREIVGVVRDSKYGVAGGGSRAGGLPAARAESRNRHGPVRPRLGPAGLTRRQPSPRDSDGSSPTCRSPTFAP